MHKTTVHCNKFECNMDVRDVLALFLNNNKLVTFQTQFEGLTGSVWLDDRGKRSSFSLNLVEVTKDGLKKVLHCYT